MGLCQFSYPCKKPKAVLTYNPSEKEHLAYLTDTYLICYEEAREQMELARSLVKRESP